MFGKARKEQPKRDRSNRNLAQYGLFDVSMDGGIDEDLGGDDSDLEAELRALSSGNGAKPKRPQRKQAPPAANLDVMVAESMKDIPSDAELSGDDDDPDLLNELSEIAGDDEPEPEPESKPASSSPADSPTNILKLLQERLQMYETAEKNAKESGQSSRARRFGRGIKTLKDLIKQANAGRNINNDDIPPIVTVNVQKNSPSNVPEAVVAEVSPEEPSEPALQPIRAAPEIPVEAPEAEELSPETKELLELLSRRKDEYKIAALTAKKTGDSQTAISYIKIAKQFEMVMKAVESGQPVDLSRMPGPPSQPAAAVEQNETQAGPPEEPALEPIMELTEPLPEPTLITASSVAEALQQRLEVYQQQEAKAKEDGNSSKARRMGRIVKQYEDAIKRHKAGKPIPVEDLPTPPGYAPIPVEGASAPKQPEPQSPPPAARSAQPQPAQPQPALPQPQPSQINRSNTAKTRIDKQVALLMARQKEFKEAALNAKKKGEITQAKEFLRAAKGFDPLISAAQGGFPVDIASLPVPPSAKSQLEEEYEVVMGDEITEMDPEHLDILSRLEQQLTKQLKLSLSTRDHNKAIGDVAGMNRFEQLALSVTRDLDIVRLAKKNAATVPKFHYETKDFSIVKSCTDLNDNDLELTIVRGVNYNCNNPKDIDTYIKFEFPYPQEEPVRNKTAVVKDTNNPEYNEKFMLPIQRTARPCLRVFKRHAIKFEVYSRGGFFRGDSVLGTVSVKLQPLETQCELHESFDILEGRKKVGGKLEIHLRVRDPLVTRQVEQLSEKWLVIDH